MTQNGPRNYEDVSFNTHHLFVAIFKALPKMLVITALLCAMTYAWLSFSAKEYSAEASVLLEPRSDSFAEGAATRGGINQAAVDNAAISSQIQLLKSRETLLSVVDKLELRSNPEFVGSKSSPLSLIFSVISAGSSSDEKPNSSLDDKIVATLNKNLVAAQARDSRVISIKYTAGDPQTAADIANALAQALVERRSGLAIEDTSDATKWLEQEIDRLRKDVLDAESKVANFRVNNDLFSSGRDTTLIGQQLSDLARQISAATERKNAAATRAKLIRDLLRTGQSLDSVPDVRQSPMVQRMAEQKANFQASRAQAAATLLSNHPTLQALDAQIRDVDRQIAEEGRRIAASLDTQAKIEGELERSLQDELTRLKLSASGAERSSVELAELEREATAKRNLLNTFLARQNEATARTNTGAIFPDVRIISTAAVPTKPSWPNKPMMLILVAALSLLIQVGMVIIRELVAGNLITARGQQTVPAPVAATQEPIVQHEEPASAVVAEVAPQLVQTETATVKAAEDLAEVQAAPAEAPPAPETHDPMTDVRVLAGQVIAEKRDVVLVATGENNRADSELADALLVTLTTKSRTAIVINAGGRDQMATAGLTDMCAGEVDFGQIIHRGQKPNQYFVPWGTKDRLDFNSERFTLMIEALSEVYDHVIVECGRVGLRAPLAPFADSDALLVMVSSDQDAIVAAELISDLEAVGINQVHQLAWNNSASNVA
jgi:uncharacterized protein involved in exopolysaccharide biosynthesis